MIVCKDLTKRYTKTKLIGTNDSQNDETPLPVRKGQIFGGKKGETERVHFAAVDHVSFSVGEGEIVGILGPNGAGKTTLLRMMSGLLEPDEGEVEVLLPGKNKASSSMELKKSIGFLSNNTRLYERFSARELLRMLGGLYEQPEEITKERINRIIERLKMQEFSEERISSLSTGQKQRVSISRCFIHDPSVFIFDEPTLGLDILSARVIIEMMLAEKEAGKTVLYSTHYMEEAGQLCDRIIMLDHGKMIENASVSEILEKTEAKTLREAFFTLTEGRPKP